MALFLKPAIDNHWIGPLGRVLIGLAAGAGFIAWSERFQRRGYAALRLLAQGRGERRSVSFAVGRFLTLPSPAAVAFAAIVLVTAFNGFIA